MTIIFLSLSRANRKHINTKSLGSVKYIRHGRSVKVSIYMKWTSVSLIILVISEQFTVNKCVYRHSVQCTIMGWNSVLSNPADCSFWQDCCYGSLLQWQSLVSRLFGNMYAFDKKSLKFLVFLQWFHNWK